MQQAGHPELAFEMIIGVILIQIMPPGSDFFYHLPGQGLTVDLYSPNEALGHTNTFVSQHQLGGGADHAVVHISDVMD